MFRVAINISMGFREFPFLDRINAAAEQGFKAVEILVPYEAPIADLKKRLDDTGVKLLHINAPIGDRAKGDRGRVSSPGREKEFAADITQTLEYAEGLGVKQVHVSSGVMQPGVTREQ